MSDVPREGSGHAGPTTLVLRNVRVPGRQTLSDVVVRDAVIDGVLPAGTGPTAEQEVDGSGTWAIPGLVDLHAHLDKTLVGLPYWPNPGGRSVLELAETEREARSGLPGSVEDRVLTLLRRLVRLGTSFIRSHVDIDTTAGLANLHAVLAAKDAVGGTIDIETVAFPQSGLLRRPGTIDLMAAAMAEGADLVGGLDPASVDDDPAEHLDSIFGLAERTGAGIDIHLHDPGELGAWQIQQIVNRTVALGMQGKVTISHAMALAEVSHHRQVELLEQLAQHEVSIATVAPGRGSMLPVLALLKAGVNLGCGNDGVRDMWNPHATGDMVERAKLLAWRCGFRTDEDIELALVAATHGGARAMQIERYGVEPGGRADLVLVPGDTIGEVVTDCNRRRWVVKQGVVVSKPDGAQEDVT